MKHYPPHYLTKFNIRKALRASSCFSRLFYALHIDDIIVEVGGDGFNKKIKDAYDKFLKEEEKRDDILLKKLERDIKNCYHLIKAMPDEYFLYGLRNISKEERTEFITDKIIFKTMGELVPRKKHDLEIEDKMHFYTMAKQYFKRKCVEVKSRGDYEDFDEMTLSVHEVMLKPNAASLGKGIEAKSIHSKDDAREVFENMIGLGGHWIVEERIRQSKEMAAWNESSCNTVRVMTFLNNKVFHVMTPFIRIGRKGSVVDNAGSGGIFANVDAATGVIYTDGVDESSRTYEKHPDSGITFKGWQIPKYKDLLNLCRKMHETVMPAHPYIGWDMALTDCGWVVVECNWGQCVNQIADHKGRRKEFLKYAYGR